MSVSMMGMMVVRVMVMAFLRGLARRGASSLGLLQGNKAIPGMLTMIGILLCHTASPSLPLGKMAVRLYVQQTTTQEIHFLQHIVAYFFTDHTVSLAQTRGTVLYIVTIRAKKVNLSVYQHFQRAAASASLHKERRIALQ